MTNHFKWFDPINMEDSEENEYKAVLQEQRDLDAEMAAIGGGPNWTGRWEANQKRINDLFSNDDEARWQAQQESHYG